MTFLHDWILAFCLLVCFLSYTNIHGYKHKITALSKRKTVVDPREGRELGVEVGPPSNKNCGYLDFSFEKKKKIPLTGSHIFLFLITFIALPQ